MSSKKEQNSQLKNVTLIPDDGLYELQIRPSLVQYLVQLWQSRHFIMAEAKGKVFSTGRDTFLGKLWIVLDPLLQVAIYAFIFGAVLQISRGMENFIGFLVIGVIYFRFLTQGIGAGSGLIRKSRALISSFNFPRASLAFSVNLKNIVDNFIPAVLGIIVATLFQLAEPIHWTIAFVIPLYLLIYIFTTGATLIVARATAFVPDMKSLVNLLNRGLFFVSGVFFDVERFATNPTLRFIMEINPVYQFLTAIRSCVLEGEIPEITTWLYLMAWSFGLFIIGFIYFWAGETRYASVK